MSNYFILKNCQCGLILVVYMNAYLKCLKRWKKKKTCVQRVFIFIFTEFIYKDFTNRFCFFHYSLDQVCVVSLSDFYQKLPLPLLYASWSWPKDWEVIITKWKKWIKPIHRTNFFWGGGLILIAGLSFQLDYYSNCSKMD